MSIKPSNHPKHHCNRTRYGVCTSQILVVAEPYAFPAFTAPCSSPKLHPRRKTLRFLVE
jgi:hypothetical protein